VVSDSCRRVLVLENDAGNAKPVSEAALTALFQTVKDDIRLVLLNACHSEAQARAISHQIECTVGMSVAIGDEAAIIFASTFYGALVFGRSVGEAFEQGRIALMLHGIPEETTPTLLVRPGIDALRVSFVNRKPANPILPPLSLEILQGAVSSNTPINLVRYGGGIAVVTGERSFDCNFDLEQAALLEHALNMLIQVGWIHETQVGLYHVTHAGYEADHRLKGQSEPGFFKVKEQMSSLIAEMKEDLQSESGQFVREFFVMSKRHTLAGSSKPRFIYYEEDHDNLRGKIDILESLGYVVDVTPGNTPIYRMTEDFVNLVLN